MWLPKKVMHDTTTEGRMGAHVNRVVLFGTIGT
jgi:hypothetical protein